MDHTIRICGEAGQGIQTVGGVLSRVFARAGFHVFTHQDYESRIRGGHNFYQIRVSDRRVIAHSEKLDILVALDKPSFEHDRTLLAAGGVTAYDSESLKSQFAGEDLIDIPFTRLAREEGGNAIMANTVATGAVLGLLGMELDLLDALLQETFRKKGDTVVEGNLKSARAGHRFAQENCPRCSFNPPPPGATPHILINGSEAAALGAMASGLKFYAAYPMTPSTGILNNIAARAEKLGIIVEQAEDEVAAVNMALGASFAGVRAATGSSGGGFALMVEGVSLAGITETPLVVFEVQRPGPATGLPTRTEQADLMFILHSGHGEFPRAVLAPGSPEQAISLTNKAFHLAEKYQITSFVLMDQHLADSEWTYEGFDPGTLLYEDFRLRGEVFASLDAYQRHAYTQSGVSPLAVPGDAPHVVVTDSDEHDEAGHIIEDAETRIKMVEKRLHKKLAALKQEMSPPLMYGQQDAELVLAGWGSSYGALKETVDALGNSGTKAAMLFFNNLYPLPDTGWLDILKGAQRTVCVEGNATGQFARLLRMETGHEFDSVITRFDGRPLSVSYIMEQLHG